MSFENYLPGRIINDELKLTVTDYELGIAKMVDLLLDRYQDQVAIYRFGSISTPGISDVDLLIIIDDIRWAELDMAIWQIIQSDDSLKYLFVHPPVIIGRSLVSSLVYLHTLENCVFLAGAWDLLITNQKEGLDKDSLFMRHAVWSSFMRYSAVRLGNSEIHLRDGLLLLNNLLNSVNFGNIMLSDPVPISATLNTQELRELILSTEPNTQTDVFIHYVQETINYLNLVDEKIDQQLYESLDLEDPGKPILAVVNNKCLIAPLGYTFQSKKLFNRFTSNTSFIRMAKYQCYLPAVISQKYKSGKLKKMSFADLSVPSALKSRFAESPFVHHFYKVVSKKMELGITSDSIQRYIFSKRAAGNSFQSIQWPYKLQILKFFL